MLRLACCLLAERGIGLCAPVHDAVMVEGPADEIDRVVAETGAAMAEASRVVLRGFEIGADAKIVSWPERYVDEAGADFWETVLRLAGPVRDNANPPDLVRDSARSSSLGNANRSGLLRESPKEVSFSSIGGKG
jgi:DNA polymerase-1